ncbi:MFS transporter [Roseomonas sp. 573]|uniref:MFS transporter n=2 Tax=Roseomonas haemaphysalidis TaxID=2768162 RepID=A0ABS3KJW1_9PROT|nr:MFS transporter [Roseomonas haemaphysalidis]MBO1077727.1 MFS transporter [Roseomonas haemaphysalidis]
MVGVQFIMSVALSVLSPVLPLFLPEVGVTAPGSIEFWSGVLNALNFLVAALVSPLWGALADRFGRKTMVLRSSMAICAFTLLMGFSQSLWQLVTLRGLMGAFSGFSAAAIALVATQVPEQRLGYALGWLSTGQLVGSLAGPLIGGLIADTTGSSRMVFFFTAATAALAVLVTVAAVRERQHDSLSGKKGGPGGMAALRSLWRIQGLSSLFLVLLMAQFGVRSVQPVITLFVQELLGNKAALATLAGFAFSVTGLADLLASPFLGKRSDTLGYRKVLLISLAGAAVTTLPQAWIGSYDGFVALRFGAGLFLGGILPTANALVGRLVPAQRRGLAYGLTASATFLGSFLGPFVGGSVAALAGIRWVFVLTGVLFLANLLWVYRVVPETAGARTSDPDKTDAPAGQPRPGPANPT